MLNVGCERASVGRLRIAEIDRVAAVPVHVVFGGEFESHRDEQPVTGGGGADRHVPVGRAAVPTFFQLARQARTKGRFGGADNGTYSAQQFNLFDEPWRTAVPPRD